MKIACDREMSLELRAMVVAVSSLSPVNIHTYGGGRREGVCWVGGEVRWGGGRVYVGGEVRWGGWRVRVKRV